MADEVTITVKFDARTDNFDENVEFIDLTSDVSGDDIFHRKDVITTTNTAELYEGSGVVSGGWTLIKNHDATNYVILRPGTDDAPLMRIDPGEAALFRTTATGGESGPRLEANTASCLCEWWVVDP